MCVYIYVYTHGDIYIYIHIYTHYEICIYIYSIYVYMIYIYIWYIYIYHIYIIYISYKNIIYHIHYIYISYMPQITVYIYTRCFCHAQFSEFITLHPFVPILPCRPFCPLASPGLLCFGCVPTSRTWLNCLQSTHGTSSHQSKLKTNCPVSKCLNLRLDLTSSEWLAQS